MNDTRKAIRNTLRQLGMHAGPEQVIEAMQRYGIDVSKRLVSDVKAQLLREEARAQREQAKRPPAVKSRNRPQQRKIPGR